MKFTAGYLLGAGTAVGLIASFGAGALALAIGVAWVDDQKNDRLEKIKEVSSLGVLSDFIRKTKN